MEVKTELTRLSTSHKELVPNNISANVSDTCPMLHCQGLDSPFTKPHITRLNVFDRYFKNAKTSIKYVRWVVGVNSFCCRLATNLKGQK